MIVTCLPGCDKLSAKKIGDDPAGALTDAYEATCAAFQKKFPSLASLDKVLESAHSTNVRLEASDLITLSFDGASDGTAASGTFSFNMLGGAVGADISCWSNADGFAIESSDILGDGIYGIDLADAGDDIKSSALTSMLGLDSDTVDALSELFKSPDRFGSAMNDFVKAVREIANSDKTTVEDTTVEVDGSSVKAVSIRFPLDSDTVDAYVDAIETYISVLLGVDNSNSLNSAAFGDDSCFEVAISANTGMILSAALSIPESTGIGPATFKMLKDSTDCVDFDMSVESVTDDITLEFREKSEDGRSGFSCAYDYAPADGDASNGNVSALRSESDGKFDLSVATKQSGVEVSVTVSGALTYSDKEYELSIEPFAVTDDSGEQTELAFEMRLANDASPASLPEYVNILTLNEDELAELGQNIASSNFAQMIGSAFSSELMPYVYDYDENLAQWELDGDEIPFDFGEFIDENGYDENLAQWYEDFSLYGDVA